MQLFRNSSQCSTLCKIQAFPPYFLIRKLGGKACILRGAIYDIKIVPLLRNT